MIESPSPGMTPFLSVSGLASTSCWAAPDATMTWPARTPSSTPPASPIAITHRGLRTSHAYWAAIAAATLPTPATMTTRPPLSQTEAGRSVLVLEGAARPGGGLRTDELLEPGFRHDVCSTIMALPPLVSFFGPLGLELVTPPAPLAHPFDDGTAVIVERSVADTAARLGRDEAASRALREPLVSPA